MKTKSFMRKICMVSSVFLGCTFTHVANADLSIFSRANCFNNESFSFDWGTAHMLKTTSEHIFIPGSEFHCKHASDPGPTFGPNANECIGEAQYELTDRSAAIHVGEAPIGFFNNWEVYGIHYELTSYGERFLGVSFADDCNVFPLSELYDQIF